MPFYDYQCTTCGHEFEVLQRVSDAPLVSCPQCHEDTLRKKVAAPAFSFKGGGWYKDLYSSSDAKSDGKSGSGSADKSSSEKPSSEKSGSEQSESSKSTKSSGESKTKSEKATA